MKIKSCKIKNFRSYHGVVSIPFTDLSVFVGKNDIGKSTILEALDLFFNEGSGVVKADNSDINVQAKKEGENEFSITVCFSEPPDNFIIDSTVETSPEKEYMLNEEGLLEVTKKFKLAAKTPKATVFIKALHPTNLKCKDLLLQKNNDLKAIIEKEGINCDNLSVNAAMR